jgi:hypothetical protein
VSAPTRMRQSTSPLSQARPSFFTASRVAAVFSGGCRTKSPVGSRARSSASTTALSATGASPSKARTAIWGFDGAFVGFFFVAAAAG